MPFEFRLEKVLIYRKRVVEKHTREVAQANRTVVGIQEKVQGMGDDIHKVLQVNGQEMHSTMNVETMITRGQWLAYLEDMLKELEIDLASARAELSRQRGFLTSAWQDLEVLERLREKQKTMWLEERGKLENKELDEIGQIRADRSQREKVSIR